jgi:hypothetical protein
MLVGRCPFCGDEMRRGWVRLRGLWWAGAWPWTGLVDLNFEVMDGSGEGSHMLNPGWRGNRRRAASCCVSCEAVVVDPKTSEDR